MFMYYSLSSVFVFGCHGIFSGFFSDRDIFSCLDIFHGHGFLSGHCILGIHGISTRCPKKNVPSSVRLTKECTFFLGLSVVLVIVIVFVMVMVMVSIIVFFSGHGVLSG